MTVFDKNIFLTLEGKNTKQNSTKHVCALTFRDRRIARRPHLAIGQHGPCVREQFIVVGHQKRHVAHLLDGQVSGTGTHVAVQDVGAFQVQPSGNNNPGRSTRYLTGVMWWCVCGGGDSG